jgi:hypothetical protein
MPLNKYKGSDYLDVGWHDVTVKGFEIFTAHSGSSAVKFNCVGPTGAAMEACLWLNGFDQKTQQLSKKCLWKLAKFAKSCGLSDEQLAQYNEDDPNSHAALVGKKVKILVMPQRGKPQYCEVADFMPVTAPTPAYDGPQRLTAQGPAAPTGDTPAPQQMQEQQQADDARKNSGVPF